ncbi:glutamyl aminopeptidase-like [Rhopalosiphum padi]|uniref:glutamyl aminopeptidase-like n=1 Tax=Rhopalosiphum padi TaxID=40932 RepID=UPI00298E97A7|nr:glutamyl aminopeptidase-like [Rhopalosiphum padi]XP_060840149.1 glutamyl aminopeptidase-like [Rhopalosiphum padi]XP_060840150.1 glutamyl aminopeptidase-like [Rhopalosiphum padi]
MTTKIKWTFVLILAAVTLLTFITIIMINHTIRLKRIPEDENLTETVSADKLLATNHSSIMAAKPWESTHRLSPYVRPQQYSINLFPNLEQGSFVGSVDISIVLDTAQSYIKLHSKGLNIKETKLNSSSVTSFLYPEHEFLVIVPNEELNAGEYKLQLSFEGSLLNKIVGFYRSVYTDSKSHEQHYIATSKFEPTYARLAFPCFDEPQLKSKFKISLTRPSGNNYIALSNMNQESEEVNVPTNGLTTVHFANTVPMSTYLACFIVCDFQSLEPVKADQGFPLTVYARNGQSENMKYAQHVGLQAINFYVNYFGIQYPLPKLDLIPIPDFPIGAMEHWGLVTFRETCVLFNEHISSSTDQEYVAFTVVHELAHMWFGNLATMKWWNDLWLNEGFATYMEFKALKGIHLDWDIDTLFLIHSLQPVQYLDNKLSSHAIIQDVSHPDQITEIFDFISYDKGSSVIRMLEGTLGEEVFRIGITAYLKRFAYNNTETDDLWAELQTATQNTVEVKKVMDTWTRQAGFPVVSAIRNGTKLTLKQQRFLSNPNVDSSTNSSLYNYKWEIPITYFTSNNNTVHKFWLNKDVDSITIDIPDAEWIKLNHRQVGYYIINYSENDWYLFNKLLGKNVDAISAADRSNLIHDAFNLANANYLPYGIALNMTKYLSLEHHYVPWDVAATNFNTLRKNLYQRPAHKNLEKYVRHLLGTIKEDFWNDSIDRPFLQRKLRGVILKLGCLYGLPSYKIKVYELFKQFLDDEVKPNPDIRHTIYYYGMAQGNASEWDRLWKLFLNEQEPQEKDKLMEALTASKETEILTRLLQYTKNESYVRSQDYILVILQISRNPVGTQLVWNFLRDEWQYLVNRFSLNDRILGRLIPIVCSHFNTYERLAEMKLFFDKYPDAGAGNAGRKTALEVVSNNIKWLEKNEVTISNWLITFN